MQLTDTLLNEESILEHIGSELYRLRMAKDKKLETIAKEVGVTHPIISQLEHGRYPNVKLTLLIKLANYFKVPLQQFIPTGNTQIFHFNQSNNEGSTNNSQIGNELKEGYLLCIEQQKEEIGYLRGQLENR